MTWGEYFKENLDIDEMPKEFADKEITVEDCLKIIDGMSFTIKELLDKTKWHTGTPTEEGWYVTTDGNGEYDVAGWEKGAWAGYEWISPEDIVAWREIKPYKEREK